MDLSTLLYAKKMFGGSGANLNIAYGEEPPDDTSKIWVKSDKVKGVNLISPDTPLTFTQMTPSETVLPFTCGTIASVRVGTKVYLCGTPIQGLGRGTLHVFNTETGTMTTLDGIMKDEYRDPMSNSALVAVGTMVYILGGYGANASKIIRILDTETEIITTSDATLPAGRANLMAEAVGTKIYMFGGQQNAAYYNTIYVLDTDTMTVSSLPVTLWTNLVGAATYATADSIYLFGGETSAYAQQSKYIQVFDATTETISTLSAKLPNVASFMASAAIGDNVYLFGGKIDNFVNNSAYDTIVTFDTNSRTISTSDLKLPTPLRGATAEAVGTTIYIFGGYIGGNVYIDTIQKYGYALPLANKSVGIVADIKEFYKGNAYNSGEPVEAYIYKNGEWTLIQDTPEDSPSGMELNIAYGDTPPEDTSKLWCKCSEPSGVIVSEDMESVGGDENVVTTLSNKIPEKLSGMFGDFIGTNVYIFGGAGGDSKRRDTILRFNTVTEELTEIPTKLPKGLYKSAIGVFGEKMYMISSYDTVLCEFDTKTEIATTLGDVSVPSGTDFSAYAVVGSYIYSVAIKGTTNTLYRFDMATKTLSQVTQMIFTNCDSYIVNHACASVGTNIYVLCNNGTIHCFDTNTNASPKLLIDNSPYLNMADAISVGNKIYVFGGYRSVDGRARTDDTIWCFDVTSMEISTLSEKLPTTMCSSGIVNANNRIYLFGGQNYSDNTTQLDTVVRFIPSQEKLILQNEKLQIVPMYNGNTFPIVNTDIVKVEIDVGKVYKGNANNEAEQIETALYKDGAWTLI
jgi:hypothetical protein